jgi:tetratricopeptide (TPR) repeat protein
VYLARGKLNGLRLCFLALLLASEISAQQHKLHIDPTTEEGALLSQISRLPLGAERKPLMEQFVSKYPKSKSLPWVCGQLQAVYLQQNEFAQAIRAGERAIAVDPIDLDIYFQTLKAAEGTKDPDLVKSWAVRTSVIARKLVQTAGSEADSLAHAREVDLYTEYALYKTVLDQTNPAIVVDITGTLEAQNPQSQYLSKLYGTYLKALKQMGEVERAVTRGEELAQSTPNPNEDVLLFLADYYFQKKSQPEKTINYSNALADVLNRKPKPVGLSDQDWQRRKESLQGLAYAMSGITFSTQGLFRQADQSLRWALPYLTDDQLRAACLFHLGQADYNLGKSSRSKEQLNQALAYTDQAAAIEGPFQAPALKNARLIKAALGGR